MRIVPLSLLVLVATFSLASAHPPAADPQNSCLLDYGFPGGPSPFPLVDQTLTYLAPIPTSLIACLAPPPPAPPGFTPYPSSYVAEWGSHADPCPGAGVTVRGAYCGPVVPPGGTATCTWQPDINTVPTMLTIGFDRTGDGRVDVLFNGETPVFGPFPPGPWKVPNPYPVPAQVIGYPTSMIPFVPGTLAPSDANWVVCV